LLTNYKWYNLWY